MYNATQYIVLYRRGVDIPHYIIFCEVLMLFCPFLYCAVTHVCICLLIIVLLHAAGMITYYELH